MKITISLLVLMINLFVISGCNTVAGAGKDLQAGGRGVQRAAQSA